MKLLSIIVHRPSFYHHHYHFQLNFEMCSITIVSHCFSTLHSTLSYQAVVPLCHIVCYVQVCGESLRNVTHEMAIQILRQTPPVIKLVILREESDVLGDSNAFDTVVVNLVKKVGQGLGFSIVGRSSGVFISEVVRTDHIRNK